MSRGIGFEEYKYSPGALQLQYFDDIEHNNTVRVYNDPEIYGPESYVDTLSITYTSSADYVPSWFNDEYTLSVIRSLEQAAEDLKPFLIRMFNKIFR